MNLNKSLCRDISKASQVKKYGPVPAGKHWKSPENFSDFFP